MANAYIALGGNLGDPAAQLTLALTRLAQTPGVAISAQSSLYRSAPIGLPNQPDYCNAVCAVETSLAAPQLFAVMLEIERQAGRIRDGRRWGPRVLDLDLLHYEGVTLDTPGLKLPHPEIARRNFVLTPLAQIAPELDIPGVGRISELAAALGREGLEAA